MSVVDRLINSASAFLETPENFLLRQENVYNESKEKAKEFYDFFLQQVRGEKGFSLITVCGCAQIRGFDA